MQQNQTMRQVSKMIQSTYYEHEIILHNKSVGHKVERLPNKLVWAINSFLASKYELYEYYVSNAKAGEYQVELPSLFPRLKKYICLGKLHETYIQHNKSSEQEMHEEFKKHPEVQSYDEFCELYLMETICEIKYIAVNDITETIRFIKTKVQQKKLFMNSKIIDQVARSAAQVGVSIGDHDYMFIYSNEHRLIAEIKQIIQEFESDK